MIVSTCVRTLVPFKNLLYSRVGAGAGAVAGAIAGAVAGAAGPRAASKFLLRA
jgi:hypothetical protein